MNTTLAKQLAKWVILYSPLQMASDMIENYEGHPAFQFFRDFDPDCDESKALAGEPGEFVAICKGEYKITQLASCFANVVFTRLFPLS